MTYVKVNVDKPGLNLGVGGNKKAKITMFDMDDVLTWPARDSNGVVSLDNIVFKPGAYMISVYATQSSIKGGHKGEGDPDSKGYIQTLEFEHPGDEVAINEFDANWLNRNAGIIIEKCTNNRKKLYGTPCAPMQMISEATDDKDTCKTKFSFTSTQKGPIECDYQGTLSMDTVTDTVAADITDIDLTNGEGKYQLTSGTTTEFVIGTISNAVAGLIFTLLGSGGAHAPSVEASEFFLLANGSSWVAIAGASITFKVFKSGVDTFVAIEQSRA